MARLKDATIVINNRVPLTAEILDTCPHVKLISIVGTGYDMVDLDACRRRGIAVCNTRNWSVGTCSLLLLFYGYSAHLPIQISLPEHVFALMLSLRRQLPTYNAAVARGDWSRHPNPLLVIPPLPRTLSGSTLGLIGLGVIASQVAAIATAFNMSVLIAERRDATTLRKDRTSFDDVLARSDVLVILCPLSPATRNLISTKELALMKPNALLINCARGGIVDEAALAAALRSGQIAGAGMDVLAEEPPKMGGPLLELAAEGCERLIITPHVAWASEESLEVLVEQLIGNMEAWVEGRPRNLVI